MLSAVAKTFLISLVAWILLPSTIFAEDWPTAAGDAARTGRTSETIGDPYVTGYPGGYSVRWSTFFQYENVATVAQVITGGGRAYIGTLGREENGKLKSGRVRALSATDGSVLWTFENFAGGIAHSVTYDAHLGGTIFAASTRGELIALNAATGALRWKYATGIGGFVTNPLVVNNTVLLGSRNGKFYAVNLDGTLKWVKDVKAPIAGSAAASDGVVYFMDESMKAHALLISNGNYVNSNWPTPRLAGGSSRHYWPVVAGDYVLFRTAQPHQYNWTEIEGLMSLGCNPRGDENCVKNPVPTQAQEDAEQAILIAHNTQDPADETLKVIRRSDAAVITTSATHVGGSGEVNPPPVIRSNGDIVVEYRSKWSVWDRWGWVNPLSAMGILNPATGKIKQIIPTDLASNNELPWGNFWIIGDETSTFSIAGNAGNDRLINSYQGSITAFNFKSMKTHFVQGARDTYGGLKPLTWSRQEWHGAPRNPVTVSNGVMYYTSGGRVFAINATKP